MFKLAGGILVVIAVTGVVSEKLVKSYFTYIFLNETVDILHLIKPACKMGKTYNSVMKNIDKSRYKLFFSDFKDFATDKKQTDKTIKLLESLGKRNREEEIEYIQFVIEQTEKSSAEYKTFFDNNKKSVFLTGISLGLVIIIVLI